MSRSVVILLVFAAVVLALFFRRSILAPGESGPQWDKQRAKLVEELRGKGITDERVLGAMAAVPRHLFIPEQWRSLAYVDRPVPIGSDQTISQPFIVALMTQLLELKPTDRVLEVGTGSGYHAAVMSRLCKEVLSIEIIAELALRARGTLDSLGYRNVAVTIGDGYEGLPGKAPFDAVILTAAPPDVPEPLLQQMKVGGKLIAPIGVHWQELVLVERTAYGFESREILPVMFVPMTGRAQEAPVEAP